MSDNTQKPDRANPSNFDDMDVPTYNRDTGSPGSTGRPGPAAGNGRPVDPYERTGRAAPQEIPPAGQASGRGSQSAETTAFAASGRPEEPSGATPYADQDFAPADGSATSSTGETTAVPAGAPGPAPTQAAATPAAPTAAPANTVPVGSAATAVVGDDYLQERTEAAMPDPRRGTIDLGLLIIRLLLGVWLVLVAVATFFRLGGNEGINGLEAEYAGYLAPEMLAIAVPAMQLAAGVFLIFGLITPLFAMLATVVTSFTFLHAVAVGGGGYNPFAWTDSALLSLVLLGVSLALQFTGPGLYSFDYGRSWARRPLFSSWIFVVIAIAAGVGLWWFGAGANPFV